MSKPDTYTDQQISDAATVALLRALERHGHDRAVLSGLSEREQAAVFAAEQRVRARR
ncbi:hypothetical protein ACFQY4_46115 [Catellatospora bangladeshensis]|uniref:hypothetical protein n=1 Tax=Catellatospora bangladeshensis TaxID=310355 RepID=UPI001944348D|nr:hypothetical protein [Catellatospora bangladeshensis]